jgi:iron complex outermembrane recepter protein
MIGLSPAPLHNTTHTTMNKIRSRISATGLLLLLSTAFGLLSVNAFAQTTTTNTPPPEDAVHRMEKFVVTGSNIPQTETVFDARTVPVLTLDRNAIDKSGFRTAGELLQKMTIANGGSVPISNNATGFTPAGASTSLRGLGADATLVLINGRRVAPYPVGDEGTTAFVDLNSIPLAAVERVEVLKDGASATYGADAIAGVVNIILRRGFDGSEVVTSYGNTTKADSSEFTAAVVTGARSETTDITVTLNYYRRNAIFNRDRGFSEVPPFLSSNSSPPNLQLTRAAVNEALGQAPGAAIAGVPSTANTFFGSTFNNLAGNNGSLPASSYLYSTSRTSTYNFNEFSSSFPESERVGGFLAFDRRLAHTKSFKLYGDLIYQSVRSVNELAPSATGDFSNPGGVSVVIPARTANPILTPAETTAGARSAPTGAFNPFNPFNQDISGGSRARLAEFGNRIYRDETDAYGVTIGLKSDSLFEKWNGDLGFRLSRISTNTDNTLVSVSRLNRAMNAADPIFNPASNQYIGTTTPYNPFGYFRNAIPSNAALVNFASVRQKDKNVSELGAAYFSLSTSNLVSIAAGDVGFAAGVEQRAERVTQSPDALALTGDLIGSSPSAITSAQRKIGSIFAEMEVPLVGKDQNIPGIRSASLNVAGRYEKFWTSDDSAFVPKIGLKWVVTDDFVVRSTWGKGFREPSLYERYASSTSSLTPVFDPIRRVTEPEQSITTASNRRLKAEKSDNINVGFVVTPRFLKGFTTSLDLWQIERDGVVVVDHQDVINRAAAGAALLPGERVVRDSAGIIELVDGVFRNQGIEKVRGADIAASYVWPTSSMGRFDVGTNITYVDSYKIQNSPGGRTFEFIGKSTDVVFDPITGKVSSPGSGDDGYLQWRGQAYVDWNFHGLGLNLTGNYNDGYDDYTPDFDNTDPDNPAGLRTVRSQTTFDAQASYTVWAKRDVWYSDLKVTVGCQNIFDRDPPFVSAAAVNSTGYPGFLYNAVGRWVYVQLSKRF